MGWLRDMSKAERFLVVCVLLLFIGVVFQVARVAIAQSTAPLTVRQRTALVQDGDPSTAQDHGHVLMGFNSGTGLYERLETTSGGLTMVAAPFTVMKTEQITCPVSPATACFTTTPSADVCVTCATANAASCWIGPTAGLTTATGDELAPGSEKCAPLSDPAIVCCTSVGGGLTLTMRAYL